MKNRLGDKLKEMEILVLVLSKVQCTKFDS